MSGPKSTRYTITSRQRRVLTEKRERDRKHRRGSNNKRDRKHRGISDEEREKEQQRTLAEEKERERKIKIQQEKEKIKQLKTELTELNNDLKESVKIVDLLVERTDTGKEVQTRMRHVIEEMKKVDGEINTTNKDLEDLQKIYRQLFSTVKKVKEIKKLCDQQKGDMSQRLADNISDSILAGMNLKMEDQMIESLSHIDEQKKKIKEVLSSINKMNINSELINKCHMMEEKVDEITDDNFIDNFYAMTVLPFLKECKEYSELFETYRDEFEELVSKYQYYSDYLELPTVQPVFSVNRMEELREDVSSLEQQCEQLEEQRYISESIDEVMRDIGYHVVGNREVTKKSGRKFRNELYHFSEGTVINVTYASNGQISMELGGVDNCDREPAEAECDALCDEMVEFCGEFQEIEKRLREKGVILADRISMLPPAKEYAQIINVNDYNINETVESFETVSRNKYKNKKQVMRKE